MYEMEIKAWVDPSIFASLKAQLEKECLYEGYFHKKDRYFCESQNNLLGVDRVGGKIFRIRSLYHEAKEPLFLVTLKEKDFLQECEINREIEYQVSSEQAFVEFAISLGFEELIVKEKKSHLFFHEGFHFELNEIVGLGFFLEIEYLSEDKEEKTSISLKLREWLTHFGISHEKIETQYYFSLLLKKRK